MAPKRILVVDDTKEIARLIQSAVTTIDASIQSVVVPSAEEAALEVARRPFDLLIVDVRLPGMSGIEFTRKIRSRYADVRIIQISAFKDDKIDQEAIAAGANAYFQKPLPMAEFLTAVERLLGLAKAVAIELPLAATEENGKSHESRPKAGSKPASNLAEDLAGLRQSLAAVAVALVDSLGKPIASAGDLPDPYLTEIIPALMASLSSSEKVSRLLKQEKPANVITVRGLEQDVVCAPVGQTCMVLVLLKRSQSGVRLAIAQDELLSHQPVLEKILTDMGVELTLRMEAPAAAATETSVVTATAPAAPPINLDEVQVELDETAQELESLLAAPLENQLQTADVDAFWDGVASGKDTGELTPPDMLSYEQASRLGLAPTHPDTGV